MEMIEARKITEISRDEMDVDAVVEIGTEAVVKMIFEDGFFHGDVHPGNLLVRPDVGDAPSAHAAHSSKRVHSHA